MTQGLNRVTLIGHLGRAPEMRYTPSGRPVTSFSIVTTYSCVVADRPREVTDWFNVVAWGGLAEACKDHLVEGQHVYLEGRIKTREWHSEHSVQRSCEIVAQDVIPLQS